MVIFDREGSKPSNTLIGDVFILAGTADELEIIVAPNGLWRFLDEPEF